MVNPNESTRFSARMKKGLALFRPRALPMVFIFLLIEFFDELHYSVDSAVLPALRADLHLDYAQIGFLLGAVAIFGTLVEPVIMLLGDTRLRKGLVIGGGLAVITGLLLLSNAWAFPAVLLAFSINYPASGAFVTLAQATMIDQNPGREPQMMARWTLAGSLGNFIGPLIFAAGFSLGLGWRWVYMLLAILAGGLVLAVIPRRFPWHFSSHAGLAAQPLQLRGLAQNLVAAVRSPRLVRWVILMELADLLLDVLTGYLALYFTDVAGATPAQASVVLSVVMLASLAADASLIFVLERIAARRLLRLSAFASLAVYIAWLLVPSILIKIVLLVLLKFTTTSWYPVIQGEAYASAPGRSGAVMAITSLGGLVSGALLWLVGWVASQAGLPAAMWLLLLGPLSLVIFLPRPD